jgi:predicted metal-dependent peptidase
MDTKKLDMELSVVKTRMALNIMPFYCMILFSLKTSWDESIPTAATNGINLYLSPKYWNSLNKREKLFLLLHEAMHVALLHVSRCGNRNKEIYNYAADYYINGELVKLYSNETDMPEDGLLDHSFDGLSTDEIYNILAANPEKAPDASDLLDLQPTDAEGKLLVEDTIAKAASTMKGTDIDKLPSEIAANIKLMDKPLVPWQTRLNKYMTSFIKNNTTWSKPCRRHLAMGNIMPGYDTTAASGDILIFIDTSGSVTDKELSTLFTEMRSIYNTMNPKSIRVCTFDTSIRQEFELVQDGRFFMPDITGRGGTDLYPVREFIENHIGKLELIIIMSDLECYAMSILKKRVPLLWLVINNENAKVNFGEEIHITI